LTRRRSEGSKRSSRRTPTAEIAPISTTTYAEKESGHHAARLRELQNQQQKLLHLHYRGTVDEEVLASEQQRIDRERAEARKWAHAATHDAGEIMQALDEALTLLATPQLAYAHATPHTRRLLNQALFTALLIRDDSVAEFEQTPWVAALHRLAQPLPNRLKAAGTAQNRSMRRETNTTPIKGAVF
jgi:hypothetical protein